MGKLVKIAVCILLKSFGEITPFIVRLDLLKDKRGKETIFKISRLYKYHSERHFIPLVSIPVFRFAFRFVFPGVL